MKIRGIIVVTAAILLLSTAGLTAFAQSTMEVPAPSTQREYQAPAVPDYAPDSSSTPIQLLPPSVWPPHPVQQAPASATSPRPEPPSASLMMTPRQNLVLPSVFNGCWQGQVAELDTIQREPGARKVGFWTPKTYRLCYRRVGGGPFKLTFTETGVEPSEKIINPHGKVVPISTDGRDYATMQATLHFDEYSIDRDGAPTFTVDENTDLNCKIQGDVMQINANVYGTRDGSPWFRATWHAQFVPTPG